MPTDLRKGAEVLTGPESGEDWEVIIKYNGSLGNIPKLVGGQAELLGDNYAILTLSDAPSHALLLNACNANCSP